MNEIDYGQNNIQARIQAQYEFQMGSQATTGQRNNKGLSSISMNEYNNQNTIITQIAADRNLQSQTVTQKQYEYYT